MIIATFNVNSVRTRLPILERWLKTCWPDILFMQETKTQDEFFPELAFKELGYRSFYHGEKCYNGVAVIVKDELEGVDVRFGFDTASSHDETSGNFSASNISDISSGVPALENLSQSTYGDFATRVLTLRHKDIIILNTYVPQGKDIKHADFQVKKEFFSRVREIIDAESENKFLWLGDLNVAPTPQDVTHPENKKNHVCFCEEIREVFCETKKGLVDVLRLFDSSCVYTFYDYRVKDAVNNAIGWRIDHMLATKSLSDLAVKCWVDIEPRTWDKPSDHTPLIAEFNLP
ncbi:MAG: exodeoxyribonuclease III [Synergistaceae bacterium]|nr:exodeoxyribonuclease III [Synergistaceae bacterium]